MKGTFLIFTLALGMVDFHSLPAAQSWTQEYNGPANGGDVAEAIAVDTNGNVVVTGKSSGVGSGYDYLTIKYSNVGVPLWTNRYNGAGNGNDFAREVALDGSGSVFVAGNARGSGGSDDFVTIKYSSSGLQQWVKRYYEGGSGDVFLTGIAVDANGDASITGSTRAGGNAEFVTVKYSSDGTGLWTNRFSWGSSAQSTAIAVDGSNNVIVTGYAYSTVAPLAIATIKYSPSGLTLWTNRYGIGGDAHGIAVDKNDNVFVTGSDVAGHATIAYSKDGSPLWTNISGRQSWSAIAVHESGAVFVTGRSVNTNQYDDYATIAYSNSGVPLWTNYYNGPANYNDLVVAIAVAKDGNVFVTGSSAGTNEPSPNGEDIATIAYSFSGTPFGRIAIVEPAMVLTAAMPPQWTPPETCSLPGAPL